MAANEQSSGKSVAADPSTWSLAEKINYLFDTIRRPDGSRYSNDEVAAAMGNSGEGGAISGTYLWYLRRGERDNPTKRHLEALARFFDVSPAYFFDNDEGTAIAKELALLRVMKDAAIRRIAARLDGLSAGSLKAVAQMVEHVRVLEQLPSDSSDDPDA